MAVTIQAPTLWRRLRWMIVALGAVVAYGVIGYTFLEHWSLLDAIFMTVITLSTVGFREVRPLDTSGEILTISLVVLGVAIALVSITLIAGLIAEGEIGDRSRRRRMQRRIDAMRDHFIVCAYGRVGRAVTRELIKAEMPFVVVDPLEELEERMVDDGVAHMVADPTAEEVLVAAGIHRALGLICAVDSDATNVYITLMARSLNPDLLIVARASEPGSPDRLSRAGADRVVSPFVSSGRHMAIMALRPDMVDLLDAGPRGRRSVMVEERVVQPESGLLGITVGAAATSAPILAVRRAAGEIIANPGSEVLLADGDVVLLLSDRPGAPEG